MDSTFGQDQTSSADDLSWFSSSSKTICGSEIAFDLGLQSSPSEFGALDAKLESPCPNANLLSNVVRTTADHNKPASNCAEWFVDDALSKAKSTRKVFMKSFYLFCSS